MRKSPVRRIVILTVLCVLVWGRAWAGVPQTVTHEHDHAVIEHGEVHDHEVHDHVNVSAEALHFGHGDLIGEMPHPESESDEEHSEHHHHLHLCGVGGSALVASWDLTLMRVSDVGQDSHTAATVIRRHERLLRPPQT